MKLTAQRYGGTVFEKRVKMTTAEALKVFKQTLKRFGINKLIVTDLVK